MLKILKTLIIVTSLIGSSYSYSLTDNISQKGISNYQEYLNKNRNLIKKQAEFSYKKGYKYKDYIESIAKKNGVSNNIYALPAIESNYMTNVVGNSGSKGMWQITKLTGIDMGLSINAKKDDRYDWKKSTDAVVKRIKEDEIKFKNHNLAILSFYKGRSIVSKAINKNKSNDIFVVIEDNDLFNDKDRKYIYKYMAFNEEYDKLK